MGKNYDEKTIKKKFEALAPVLNEKTRRLVLGAEARAIGFGGVSLVSKATGIARNTISRGMRELDSPETIEKDRIRKPGAGRKRLVEKDRALKPDLDKLVEPTTRGDPESPLHWTTQSTRKLAEALKSMGHKISHFTVAALLHSMGYSLQVNKKTKEGASHPDRNAQFGYINDSVKKQLAAGKPVISVDSKKKELVGDFKNPGREWRPKGQPRRVRIHDFPIKGLGKVTPYGIYELKRNEGWVSVGIDHDTAEFAVESITRWWQRKGCKAYPNARELTITADCGGSNGYRNKLWKYGLQRFANETGLIIRVHHFPPGTSKWNKIEHQLFSFITQNWRGRPLLTHAMIVNMIASTRTSTGLKVDCILDTGKYPTGRKVSDEEFEKINIKYDKFHGEWNYIICPQTD